MRNRRVVFAMLGSALGAGLSSFTMVARDLLMAREMGISGAVDTYVISYTFVMFVSSVLATSMSGALTPAYMRQREESGEPIALGLAWQAGVRLLCVLAIAACLILVASEQILAVIASNFTADARDLARRTLCWMAGLLPVQAVVAILTVIANNRGSFVRPSMAMALPPFVAALALLLLPQMGVLALAAGTLFGSFTQLACFPAEWRALLKGRVAPKSHKRVLFELRNQYLPVVMSGCLMSAAPLIDQAMAATLDGGSVATLSYGQKLSSLIISISAFALSSVLLPHFSSMVARDDWDNVYRTLSSVRRLIIIITVPLTVLLVLYSRPLATLVFQRGAFTTEDVAAVAYVQALLVLQIPFYLTGTLYVRLISALHRNEILLYGTIISLVVKLVANLVLMRWLGVAGIALSTAVVYVVACAYLGLSAHMAAKARVEASTNAKGRAARGAIEDA